MLPIVARAYTCEYNMCRSCFNSILYGLLNINYRIKVVVHARVEKKQKQKQKQKNILRNYGIDAHRHFSKLHYYHD